MDEPISQVARSWIHYIGWFVDKLDQRFIVVDLVKIGGMTKANGRKIKTKEIHIRQP